MDNPACACFLVHWAALNISLCSGSCTQSASGMATSLRPVKYLEITETQIRGLFATSSVKAVPKQWYQRWQKQPTRPCVVSRICSTTEKLSLTPNSYSRPAPQIWEKAGIADSGHLNVGQAHDCLQTMRILQTLWAGRYWARLDCLWECGIWHERWCSLVSFLQGRISRIDSCGAPQIAKADARDNSN